MSETPTSTHDIIMKLKGYEGKWIATESYIHFSSRDWDNNRVRAFIEENDFQNKVTFLPSDAPWVGPKIVVERGN